MFKYNLNESRVDIPLASFGNAFQQSIVEGRKEFAYWAVLSRTLVMFSLFLKFIRVTWPTVFGTREEVIRHKAVFHLCVYAASRRGVPILIRTVSFEWSIVLYTP